MRPVVFIDGQNLFHLARNAWAAATGVKRYTWPSYDVQKLSQELTDKVPERTLAEIRFYTGVPDLASKPFWHGFWTKKLRVLTNQGIIVYKGRINNGQEKGVDVKLALDVVQLTHENRYDCAIVVSQDWDFGPAISLAKVIANNQSRTVIFESAFAFDTNNTAPRGIPGTRWVHIDKTLYDACYDPRDYRTP